MDIAGSLVIRIANTTRAIRFKFEEDRDAVSAAMRSNGVRDDDPEWSEIRSAVQRERGRRAGLVRRAKARRRKVISTSAASGIVRNGRVYRAEDGYQPEE